MYAYAAIPILGLAAGAAATSVTTTPHDAYSSSVGVLGCKIDTNRVAYWPGSVDCNNICVKLSYGGRSVNLLRIDQSGGAYDISYDAWAYLQTGKSATADPLTGGGVAMDYEEVDASECADLIKTEGSKLPLSASNSMNFVSSCLSEPSSWVAQNHVLYNICDAACTLGYDETCTLDLATSNQPSCPHTLGLTSTLTTAPVYDIEYESGKVVVAGSGATASSYAYAEAGAGSETQAASSTVQAASTTSAEATYSAAVFLELTSSSTSVAQYSTASPSTAVASTTSYPATTSSSSQSTSTKTSESSTQTFTASATVSSVPSYSETTSGSATTITSQTSARASSTFSVVTVSSSRSSASSSSISSISSSAATATAQPSTSGHSKTSVPVLALVSSIIMGLVVSAL